MNEKFEVVDVRRDGNCYFRALSLILEGTEDNYKKYKKELAEYLEKNKKNYS